MINSREELEATIKALEDIHGQLDVVSREYDRLPAWALIRQHKNLRLRGALLASTKPHWTKLNEGLAWDPNGLVKSVVEVFKDGESRRSSW